MLFEYVSTFCRIVIAFVFLISFAGKIRDVSGFELTVVNFGLLPQQLTMPAARAFLGLELAAVILLVIGGKAMALGFLLALLLLTIFSVALVVLIHRKSEMSCNCFGQSVQKITYYDVLRNALLAISSILGLLLLTWPTAELTFTQIVTVGFAGVSFGMLFTHFADVIHALLHPFEVQ